jgi:MFS family permease
MSRRDLLRHVPLRALVVAEVISTTGSQMTWPALPWFVLVTTHSPERMTFVMLAEVVGLGLAGLPAGGVLERLGARTTMLTADAIRAPLMLGVPVLHWTGNLDFAALLGLAFLLGAFGGPYFAAQRVIVPELLGEDEATVSQANALTQAAQRTTLLLGPPLAGVLIGVIGAAEVLVIDAATYLVSFVLVLGFVPRTQRMLQPQSSGGVLAGLRFLVREPLLRVWIPIFVVGDAGWTAFFATVPVLVLQRFGSDARIAGLLFAGFGAGALVGNFLSFNWLTERIAGFRLIAASVPVQAAPLWLFAFHLPAGVLVLATFLSGVGNGVCNPTIHATFTLRMPPEIRAKAMTAAATIWAFGSPLGLLTAGPILAAYGAQPMLVAFALVQSLTMSLIAAVSLREHARGAPEPAVVSG